MDSLTRRQGWVPEDEPTCEATNQRKTVLQCLGNPQTGLTSILEQRLRRTEPIALRADVEAEQQNATHLFYQTLSEKYHLTKGKVQLLAKNSFCIIYSFSHISTLATQIHL